MKKIMFVLALLTIGCTENARAREYGGTVNVKLPCGQKLVTATWKETHLWYLTRPMEPTDEPVTSVFHEDSSWGLMNGTVNFQECKVPVGN